MKSKITKIQILKKGIALALSAMFLVTPITYATTSLDDSYLESSVLDQLLYGTIGSTVKEIEEYFRSGETTLYITNETQLRAFAEYVNNGNACRGKEIILLNDIELDNENEWVPIGNIDNPFSGTFNGKGNIISGVRIIQDGYDAAKDVSNVGLFGFVYNGTITRVNFNDIKIDAKTGINIGSLVGYLKSGNISLCDFIYEESDDVSNYEILGSSNVGGIVGKAEESIIDSCNNDNFGIWSDNDYSMMYVGGIVGYTENTEIKNCSFSSHPRLYNSDYVGGIVGYANNAKIDNCITKGTFSAGNIVGGIVGWLRGTSTVKNCSNDSFSTVSSGSSDEVINATGGIVGEAYNEESEKIIISNSLNTSSVYSKDNNKYDFVSLGGIVGCCNANIDIVNCLNEGNVMSFSGTESEIYEYEGGIIGNSGGNSTDPSKGTIQNCVSSVEGLNIIGDDNNNIKIQSGSINYDILGANIPEDQGVIESTLGVTKVIYTITKNGTVISEKEYFKAGDILKVTANFDKYLAKTYGPLAAITEAPTLKINDSIEMTAGKINANNSSYTTSIEYTYTVQEGDNFDITSLNLYRNGTIYAVGSDYATVHPTISVTSVSTSLSDITIDTTKPIITTKVYVENMLETERYTAGKEILFEVKTSETIQGLYEVPQIQVSFSESGIGKYNYLEEEGKSGLVKCKDAVINLDGTTTWTFSYQVQERDEGELEFTFTAGEIVDLAGNRTNIKDLYKPSTTVTSGLVTGEEWADDLNITYEFYKNSVSEKNKVTSQTYFTNTDDLIVVATYDKVLYVLFGKINNGDYSELFSNSYKSNAPSIYLNNEVNLKSGNAETVEITGDNNTKFTYKFEDIAKNYGIKTLTQISSISSKNDNNHEKKVGQVTLDGKIGYSDNRYTEYTDENAENVKYLSNNAITKTTGLDDILIDPIGVSTKIEKSNIYADTTAPTVEITANKPNPTNADLIKYTFKFSEVVEGFIADDVTVNGGVKATKEVTIDGEVTQQPKFVEVVKGLEYTLEVEPTITAGNEGVLQVIVEEGAVKDLVAINNVRQENNITIDKVVPTVEITADKAYVNADEKITYTFTWSEKIVSTFKEGVIITNGEIVDKITQINDFQYTMGIKPANGNDVEVLISNGTTKDIAGNENIEAKHTITVIPTVTITTNTTNPTNANEIEYTFTWSEEVNGFTKEDIILPEGITGTLSDVVVNEDGTYSYKMVVNYNSLIPAGNEGEVTVAVVEKAVKDSNGNENAYTTNTLKIDRIAPIFVSLEAHADSTIGLNAEVDTVKEYYKAGDKIVIIATFTENIEKSTAPALALQFSDSGNAKGTIGEPEKIGNQIKYTYEIKDKDNGTLSVRGFSGEVKDVAGNITTVGKKSLDGNTIIADTTSPNLTELKVTSTQKANNAGDDITIEAVYSEEIYALITKEDGTKEIVNISNDNAPKLDISFGGKSAKGNMTAKYATKEDGTPDKTRIVYTYKVVGDEEAGDNGELVINKLENSQVCDIAGNTSNNTTSEKSTNGVYADTIKPKVDNITASVEDPTIANTGIYHKAGNEIKITVKFSEDVHAAKLESRILVGFSEDKEKEPSTYKEVLDLNATTAERTYSYIIQDGDNGYLWVKVEKEHYADEAGNKNSEDFIKRITDNEVYADTTDPYLSTNSNGTTQWEIEYVKNADGQVTGIKAVGIFNEKIFSMDGNKLVSLKDIPTMGVFINAVLQKTVENPSVDLINDETQTQLTYEVDITDIDTTGIPSVNFIDGTVYDRAGNQMSIELVDGDVTSPIFKDIKILNPNGFYKAGEIIEIVARFEEETKLTYVPTLTIRLGNKVEELRGTYNAEDPENTDTIKVARYTYTIVEGNNGALNIVSLFGKVSDGVRSNNNISQTYIDLTEDDIDDVNGKAEELLNSLGNKYANSAEEYKNVIADTINPYITNITVNIDGKDESIATYTKEEGITKVGRVNVNQIEYIVTFSEPVPTINKDNISITNGIINKEDIQVVENTNHTQYRIKVQTTVEGVQSLIIANDAVKDRAGNSNVLERFNIVTTDFTKPTVRFISEYNGGVYVLPINAEKIEIRPNVEISEDISNIEFKWAKINENGEWEDIAPYASVSNYSSSSDIPIDTQAFGEGEYQLSIKVVDLAGNVAEANKTYAVINSNINIDLSTTYYTNQDITVTVTFGDGLTDNRKVTFKAEGSEELEELNAIETETNEDGKTKSKYRLETNGTIYAEATDRVGNKVFTEEKVGNIDKDAPEITFNEIPYSILKGEELDVTIYLNEYAIISYSWDNENWVNETKYLDSKDITKSFEETGEYTLYVKAKDKAGNESTNQLNINVTNLDFEVWGNVEDWTSQDVELYVYYDGELASITVNETAINVEERVYVAKENGDYVFVITDKYGNTATKTVKVEKIDKESPIIENIKVDGKEITITAKDDKAGIKEYAISTTSEIPVEWNESKVIKTTEDGIFYVWVKDKVGNISRSENAVIVDTTAPTVTFSYTSLTVTVGVPLETSIVTNEDATISYSWDNENWVDSEEKLTSLKVSEKSTTIGKHTLYVKAKDESGNESKVQTLEFNVVNIEEIRQPEIVFEDIPTVQVNGVKYVKVSTDMTAEILTDKMNKEALCGKTPEYTKLTEDNKLKTGSEIAINGSTKYVIVVNGDVNCDGEISFLGDVVMANNYRIGQVNLTTIQRLAADVNNNGTIDFISDIVAINNYRLGIIKSL